MAKEKENTNSETGKPISGGVSYLYLSPVSRAPLSKAIDS